MEDLILLEYRCTCNHLLFKGLISPGSNLQIKCKNCGKIVVCGMDYFSMQEHVGDRFIFLLGDQAQVLDASPSATNILGYTINELKKMSVFDFVSGVSLPEWYKLMEVLDKTPDKLFVSETNFTTKEGGVLRLRTKFKRHQSGVNSPVVVFYEVIGVSDKKYNVLKSEPFSILDLIAEIHLDGTILYVSDELTKKFKNKKRVDILGLKIFDFFEEKQSSLLISDFNLIAKIQKTIVFNEIILVDSPEKFNLFMTPIYYPDNRLKGFKIILQPAG